MNPPKFSDSKNNVYFYCTSLWLCSFSAQHVPPAFYTDPNEIAQHLPLKLTECEKLEFPEQEPPAEMATAAQWRIPRVFISHVSNLKVRVPVF